MAIAPQVKRLSSDLTGAAYCLCVGLLPIVVKLRKRASKQGAEHAIAVNEIKIVFGNVVEFDVIAVLKIMLGSRGMC